MFSLWLNIFSWWFLLCVVVLVWKCGYPFLCCEHQLFWIENLFVCFMMLLFVADGFSFVSTCCSVIFFLLVRWDCQCSRMIQRKEFCFSFHITWDFYPFLSFLSLSLSLSRSLNMSCMFFQVLRNIVHTTSCGVAATWYFNAMVGDNVVSGALKR